jgi:hypothetical protein
MQCLADLSSHSLSSAAAVSAMRCRAWHASTCEICVRGALVWQHGQGLRLAKYGELVALRAALMKVCLSLSAATGKVALIHLLTIAWPCMPCQH